MHLAALARCHPGEEAQAGKVDAKRGECAPGCKRVFIGDGHCDKECYNEECEWDGKDCDKSCELRRMIVMGPYYKEVSFVNDGIVEERKQARQNLYSAGHFPLASQRRF